MRTFIILTYLALAAAGPPVNSTGYVPATLSPMTMSCAKARTAYQHSGCCDATSNEGFVPPMTNCKAAVAWGYQTFNTTEWHLPIGSAPSVPANVLAIFQEFGMPLTTPIGVALAGLYANDALHWWWGPKSWRSAFTHLMESARNAETLAPCTQWTAESLWSGGDMSVFQQCGTIIETRLVEIAPSCDMVIKNLNYADLTSFLPIFGFLFKSFQFTYMIDRSTCGTVEVPRLPGVQLNITSVEEFFNAFNTVPGIYADILPASNFNKCMDLT